MSDKVNHDFSEKGVTNGIIIQTCSKCQQIDFKCIKCPTCGSKSLDPTKIKWKTINKGDGSCERRSHRKKT